MTIINDDSRVITKLETSLTDNTRVIIYDHHVFIIQATGGENSILYLNVHFSTPVLIRHLCQLKELVFPHRCLLCAVLFPVTRFV